MATIRNYRKEFGKELNYMITQPINLRCIVLKVTIVFIEHV